MRNRYIIFVDGFILAHPIAEINKLPIFQSKAKRAGKRKFLSALVLYALKLQKRKI